jgi:hypothetical protein
MIIQIDQSGGFAGIPKRMELDTDNIIKSEAVKIKKFLKVNVLNKNYNQSKKKPPKGAADYYTYRITIHEGPEQHVITCDEYNIEDELKKLIKFVERMSKKKTA